ncbi:MAG: shikimate dehydrogenase [Candidatus Margulisiibacteriota bacterium]
MKTVALIGYPLGHSISPAMHNAAFRQLGLDFEYVPLEVSPDELAQAIEGLRALHFAGFNVTVPFKEKVMPYLDDITKLAQTVGAVNCVQNQEGKLVGFNTDAPGFLESLREDAGFDPRGKDCLVIGAGGAGRAVATGLAESHAKTILIYDVLEEKARELAEYLSDNFDSDIRSLPLASIPASLTKSQLLINSSPIGMYPRTDNSPLPDGVKIHNKMMIYDLVYNPAETKLLKQAKAAGAKAVSGLGMLVRQGALAFTVFTGKPAPIVVMFEAAKQALSS